jgi:hypothetical protein
MTKRNFPRFRRPNWWVIGPYILNLMLWAVIVWGADGLHKRSLQSDGLRPTQPADMMIANLRPAPPEGR